MASGEVGAAGAHPRAAESRDAHGRCSARVPSSSSSTSASRVRRFLVDNHFDSPSTAISSTPQMKFDANAEPDQLPSDMLMPVWCQLSRRKASVLRPREGSAHANRTFARPRRPQ